MKLLSHNTQLHCSCVSGISPFNVLPPFDFFLDYLQVPTVMTFYIKQTKLGTYFPKMKDLFLVQAIHLQSIFRLKMNKLLVLLTHRN